MMRLNRRGFCALGLTGLAACGTTADPLTEDLVDLGDFRLVAPIVVSDNLQKIPPSRDATAASWEAAMKTELSRRFDRYQGDRGYYIAISLDGYALAPPGVPVVLTPKSILVVTANLWTADPQEKVAGPTQLTTFEGAEGLIVGSGLIKSAEEQQATLVRNMAGRIQAWMIRDYFQTRG
ncbi:hypothetical protein [Jannaschia aquimarina]|uniref:Lipoprotein n=1 Tax=Jannaschia aquimarina TaxID=935700 RepID=A0A0D1DDA8_9RHOB|nr:hypothetical protein [Jannaschia aquimarina]KIT17983.1 hypothetical protein jaqu_02100 [Jannaschia aquimarina]SNS87945.1 hypothetical protein SAMN05421775_103131 [Jannaschia aquimarina]